MTQNTFFQPSIFFCDAFPALSSLRPSSTKRLSSSLSPLWYPLIESERLEEKSIQKIRIQSQEYPLVLYKKKKEGKYILHSDVCPHQGASLSEGWLNEFEHLQCPYHGFEFCNGMFCRIPNPSKPVPKFVSKYKLSLFPVIERHGMLFFFPFPNDNNNNNNNMSTKFQLLRENLLPFFPPEEEDARFRSITGSCILDVPCQMLCENLLDMLHISYVHSFGSRYTPLPFSREYTQISNYSGRSTFYYHPYHMTISRQVGKVTSVIVENEFHLPTDTITRVIAGNIVKTVFTRSLPISENKTLLFWKVYRNFWIDPVFPIFTGLGDFLMSFLMKQTIKEDASILKHVYPSFIHNNITKIFTPYDITIHNFRKSQKKLEIESKKRYDMI